MGRESMIMTLPLRNLIVQLEVGGGRPEDLERARQAVLSSLSRPNFVTLIAQGFMLDPSFDIMKTLDMLNLTLVQSATICYALFRSSQSQQQRQHALLSLIREIRRDWRIYFGERFQREPWYSWR